MEKRIFINKIVEAINEGHLAIFGGAGLSAGSGYVSWKELLREVAEELGLKIDQETDLISIAQYYFNHEGGRRTALYEKIVNQFSRIAQENIALGILVRLPIRVFWTTNYDHLIEDGCAKLGKIVDVKQQDSSLSTHIKQRDVVVYKLHGDILSPESIVITRDDYEAFEEKKPLLINTLVSDLLNQTFLFIGYSFSDPNFERILSHVRRHLLGHTRDHYCIMKRPTREEFGENFQIERIRQDLRIKDLLCYGIHVLEIDSFEEIPEILREVEKKAVEKNIFISGSAADYSEFGTEKDAIDFIKKISGKITRAGFRIFSGFGIGVGNYVVEGISEAIPSIESVIDPPLVLKVFPQDICNSHNRQQAWERLRRNLISQCGNSLFLFGNKNNGENVVRANGVKSEFDITKEYGRKIIPICSTGYVTKEIFAEVESQRNKYGYLDKYFAILKTSKDPEILGNAIVSILKGE